MSVIYLIGINDDDDTDVGEAALNVPSKKGFNFYLRLKCPYCNLYTVYYLGKYEKTTSKYRGVHFHEASNKCKAQISINGKNHNLGLYPDEIEAAIAYDAVASLLSNRELNFCEHTD